jgi:hypothetical protein
LNGFAFPHSNLIHVPNSIPIQSGSGSATMLTG